MGKFEIIIKYINFIKLINNGYEYVVMLYIV